MQIRGYSILLIRQADLALNHAKKQGKWCYRVYEPFLQESLVRRQRIREEMSKAFANGEFFLVYQPIFDIQAAPETKLLGMKPCCDGRALLLICVAGGIHTGGGKHQPDSANRKMGAGRSLPILGEIPGVLRRVCQRGGQYFDASVGVTQFCRAGNGNLAAVGVPAEALNPEITESVLMSDVGSVSCLSALGLWDRYFTDDFGTGYSSFAYLAKLPILTLKIDKTLVDDLAGDSGNNSLLLMESLIYMSSLLGYKVVAEGGTPGTAAVAERKRMRLLPGIFARQADAGGRDHEKLPQG